jgi:DNA-directed RNA polymerase specialized sigma24 family protein
VSLAEASPAVQDRSVEVLALDEAITGLAARSARQAQVAEMRLFGGMLVHEVAEAIGVSERTVKDDWRVARAWLARRLRNGAET